ncbi:MAG: adenylate kinase family protein [Promethearchaeota archaeon]
MAKIPLEIILLSGNPGTGKTSSANILEELFQYTILHLGDIVIQNDLYSETDSERDAKIVDEDKLDQYLSSMFKKVAGKVICEGHYADLVEHPQVSLAIVLRAHPETIIQRLSSRKYSQAKLRENAEAEFLGDCTSFMLEKEELIKSNRVFEVDTTNLTIVQIVKIIQAIISDPDMSNRYKVGEISWLSDETVDIDKFIRI